MNLTREADSMVREAVELQRKSRVAEAMLVYERILARWPQLADCWFNLAFLQRQSRRLPEALYSYQRALDAGVARPEEAHLNRSVIFTDYLGRHADAERELRLALARNPRFMPALLNLANLHEDLGRRLEAASTYAEMLALDPRCFEALARLANLQPPQSDHSGLIAQLQGALGDPGASPADRAVLGFALGRLFDAAERYPEAFAAYEAANRASRAAAGGAVARYDRAAQHAFVDRLMHTAPPAARPASPATSSPRPIFICGMFRSGSTLVEQLLAGCPGVAAPGELDFLPRLAAGLAPFPESLTGLSAARLDALAAAYRDELARLSPGAVHVIDKRPDNFLYVGLIKALLPDARIVHTRRNPLDNCLSIYFLHLDQQMSYALDLMDIGHYFREYRRLMTHWQQRFSADIVDVDYDALVREPLPVLETLCGSLGLEWGGGMPQVAPSGRAIKTASVWQVREPLYRTSSGRARHYAAELEPLRASLADLP